MKMRLNELSKDAEQNKQNADVQQLNDKIASEDISFESDLKRCKWLLILSGLFFILGLLLIIIGLNQTLSDATKIL